MEIQVNMPSQKFFGTQTPNIRGRESGMTLIETKQTENMNCDLSEFTLIDRNTPIIITRGRKTPND